MKSKKVMYFKPLTILLIIPLFILFNLYNILNVYFRIIQKNIANKKLNLEGQYSTYWKENSDIIEKTTGEPVRSFTYYKVRNYENAPILAERFGIDHNELSNLNPEGIISGATVKIPPITKPLEPLPNINPSGKIEITESNDTIIVETDQHTLQTIDLFQVRGLIKDKSAIEEVEPKHVLLKKNLVINDNVRLQILSNRIDKLDLKSNKNDIAALTSEGGQILIKGLTIRSWDTQTKLPDIDVSDKRAFIRARRSSRMDIIDSDISYLGYNAVDFGTKTGGGTYGVSWRIPDNRYGIETVTGWVENSKFHNNYFGIFTFGASGMVFRSNEFFENDVYGLDPHDDSSNMLVENNKFHHNGKHGFIVSKRCTNNIIRNNLSYENKGHGFMFHQDSNNNLLEQNTAFGNKDNAAVFSSNSNVIRNNILYKPRSANIRINSNSNRNIILNNNLKGSKGIYIYEQSANNLIKNNKIESKGLSIDIDESSNQNLIIENNLIGNSIVKLFDRNRVIIGPNSFEKN